MIRVVLTAIIFVSFLLPVLYSIYESVFCGRAFTDQQVGFLLFSFFATTLIGIQGVMHEDLKRLG